MQVVDTHVFYIPSHLQHSTLQFDIKYTHICLSLSCFSIKICPNQKIKKTSKHDFGDACGDEKQRYFLEWPYHCNDIMPHSPTSHRLSHPCRPCVPLTIVKDMLGITWPNKYTMCFSIHAQTIQAG